MKTTYDEIISTLQIRIDEKVKRGKRMNVQAMKAMKALSIEMHNVDLGVAILAGTYRPAQTHAE